LILCAFREEFSSKKKYIRVRGFNDFQETRKEVLKGVVKGIA
jgi:hypothetical protein